ncbi:hypothetical protein [Paenibacillus thermotolerans]|uniref:hypothetical protein n=1 Tax=Paenibacillus thermotolerans TaxID=3027807 RepID=UPI0023689DD7|nr:MULTISPECIES: hypothetical protein [unclassified Paenibacillus]
MGLLRLSNQGLRLRLFSGVNFTGRRIVFKRGGVAIRDMNALRFNNVLSSFRVRNVIFPNQVTLILFSRVNFQGSFRVFRGRTAVANLGTLGFDNVTSSLILVGRRLTNAQINIIRSTGIPPLDVLEIRQ